jgi:DNA-binding transcriptional regulator YiaG
MSWDKELKAEIVRLSRQEIKKQLAPVKQVNATQRTLIAKLRREIVDLQKEVAALRRAQSDPAKSKQKDLQKRFWVTGKGVKAIRKRLGITQLELAELAGVSGQTVVNWEGTEGKIDIRRKETQGKLVAIRSMSRRKVQETLGK